MPRQGSLSDLLIQIFDGQGGSLRARLAGLYTFLIAVNLAAWAWAFCSFHDHAVMLGTALLAYSLGMRHAVDADHIAAIDNVTPKLMHEGKRPISAGFWFAFGHSLIVFLAVLAIAATTNAWPSHFNSWFAPWKDISATVRTSISTLFLFVVAAMNLIILAGSFRLAHQHSDTLLNTGGMLARLFQPLFRLVTKDWHMLLLGFLFGLGFDTATEIGLLGISGTQAGEGMPVRLIMVFPTLLPAWL